MRLGLLMVMSIALAATVAAGPQQPSTAGTGSSSRADDQSNLPVSVERIRQALSEIREGKTLLDDANRQRPDFKVTVEEGLAVEKYLKFENLNVPAPPPGGIYAYELQRQFNNSVDNPLTQPYAAFSGAQFATLAIEGVVGYLLGNMISSGVSSAARAKAESAARTEVARAIAEYCGSRPKQNSPSEMCQALGSSPVK